MHFRSNLLMLFYASRNLPFIFLLVPVLCPGMTLPEALPPRAGRAELAVQNYFGVTA